ncbi:MAG: ACP S-malonyltransferase [Candidatus Gastranaerophilaceae bacterium]|nr:ACP S-malonyltransferase [Candidatus Gastranaerophilaceae bacterium]
MSKKIAFLFPGQGAQAVGMGKDLYDNYDVAKAVYETANEVLDKSITSLCFEGPEDALKQTVNTQPCIVTTSIAALEALKSQLDIEPDYVAGHSLGEYCAMYTAGVMSLETTLKAIQKRADLMGQTKGGAMAAVLNATEEVLKAGLAEGSKVGYVDVANYNSPAQVVITGDENAVKAAGDYILANGARRVVPLAVSGAFHSKYMENAGKEFENFVNTLDLNNASIPVITNVDAAATTTSADFRVKMPRQIYSSVHWTQTIQKMVSDGVEIFVEIGPGKVLAGLNKKIAPEAKVFNVFDKESLENTISSLKEELALV